MGKFGFSFSPRRALGISAMKGKISRELGVPLTKSGRERKIGRLAMGAGLGLLAAGMQKPPQPVASTGQAHPPLKVKSDFLWAIVAIIASVSAAGILWLYFEMR